MRWPLRQQILLPMVGILLLTVALVSALSVWQATARAKAQIERQLADVQQTLAAGNFPLESNVLRQTRNLTGAEFVVVDGQGAPVAASDEALAPLAQRRGTTATPLNVAEPVRLADRSLLHAIVPLDRRAVGGGLWSLHVFYPETAWREARWQAIWPPLAIGGLAIALVTGAALVVAARVTRPIEQLRRHVARIAHGDFHPAPLPRRNDEVRDLVADVNHMAERLGRYDEQSRKDERLRTVATLGAGIAHQIRNAATGCRIAIDLHLRDCEQQGGASASQPLEVAVQQLALIETHIQRLLTLGRPTVAQEVDVPVDRVVEQALALVEPMARHMGVPLLPPPPVTAVVRGDEASLVQMLVNLLVNAVEAAAAARLAEPAQATKAGVAIELAETPGHCRIEVVDSGTGPSPAITDRLFEPFATDKPGGTGLGLVVVRQIAEEHGGNVRWERAAHRTRFIVELPIVSLSATASDQEPVESLDGELAGHR